MKTDTRNNILKIIIDKAPIWASSLASIMNISNEMVHRHLKKLVETWLIYKIWTPPNVFYFPIKSNETNQIIKFDESIKKTLEENFLYFTPDWKMLIWTEAFVNWCEKRSLNPISEASIYTETLEKYNSFKDKYWFINALEKMKNSFPEVYLDELYYLDFYSIEKYWKTKLWNLMFYWKQNQDKEIFKILMEIIEKPIKNFIEEKNIDAFAFIPASIKRKVQILDEIKKSLNLKIKEFKLLKIFKDKVVSQKSLSKKEDRIINARETIFIKDRDFSCNTIVLIDDAVWSGSTLNETARKIKESFICKKIIWISIVWSYKGFEVINEV